MTLLKIMGKIDIQEILTKPIKSINGLHILLNINKVP